MLNPNASGVGARVKQLPRTPLALRLNILLIAVKGRSPVERSPSLTLRVSLSILLFNVLTNLRVCQCRSLMNGPSRKA